MGSFSKRFVKIKNLVALIKAKQAAQQADTPEYAAKQASVDTEIVESSNGKLSKNSLKIRKGRSSGSGRNLV